MKFLAMKVDLDAPFPWTYVAQVRLTDIVGTSSEFEATWDAVFDWLAAESAPESWRMSRSSGGGYLSFQQPDHAMAFKMRWC